MRATPMEQTSSRSLDMKAIIAAARRAMPPRAANIALHEPEFRGNEWTYVKECLDTGWVSSVGKYVDRFEAMLAEYTGALCVVATVNGTAALHVCLQLAGVRRGDEVLIPTLTFIATANAVSYNDAVPHFVDSEIRTLGIDANRLELYLREIAEVRDDACYNRKTGAVIRALMPMHTFGHPANLDALSALCDRWRMVLVEDAAESLGSWYRGKHTGTFGLVSALSFNGNKIVTTGGGGAILTNDAELGRLAKHVTTTARLPHQWEFLHDRVGYNYRLPNLNAALGCSQLERLQDFLRRKRMLAERYVEVFRDVAGVSIMREPAHCRSNYWLNLLLLDRPDRAVRNAILAALNDQGLKARPVWTLMHRLPMYSACPRMDLSCAEHLEAGIVNLPSSPCLAD
jgi:perosamine synthetase